MAPTLKIFTLNCWALPFPILCKHRNERIAAIGDFLKIQPFDIVVLEEIWVKSDFYNLKSKLVSVLPFSHYFFSGTIGSGVCVFSKYQIIETSFHRFHLNGHAHKIFHGDWFGGKGVGLCKIYVPEEDLDINLYCTHLHAEYNPDCDEYEAHRLAQIFELSQFIRNTLCNCDIAILAGDLNTTPERLGYKILTQYTHLKDSWTESNSLEIKGFGGTCLVQGNSYTGVIPENSSPYGVRIDYIMYRTGQEVKAVLNECCTGLGNIPNTNISYSDHEAVFITISITKSSENSLALKNSTVAKDVREILQDSLGVLDRGLAQCQSEETFFQLVVLILSIVLFLFNICIDVAQYSNNIFLIFMFALTKLMMGMAIGFCFWIAMIVKRAEFHGIMACREDILKLLRVEI